MYVTKKWTYKKIIFNSHNLHTNTIFNLTVTYHIRPLDLLSPFITVTIFLAKNRILRVAITRGEGCFFSTIGEFVPMEREKGIHYVCNPVKFLTPIESVMRNVQFFAFGTRQWEGVSHYESAMELC